MKNRDLLELKVSLQAITQGRAKLKGDRWPVALKVAEALRKLRPLVDDLEQVRQQLAEDHTDENGRINEVAMERVWLRVLEDPMSTDPSVLGLPRFNLELFKSTYDLNPTDLVILADWQLIELTDIVDDDDGHSPKR